MDITELLAFSAKNGASDLHLSAGMPPMIRVDGEVRRINLPARKSILDSFTESQSISISGNFAFQRST